MHLADGKNQKYTFKETYREKGVYIDFKIVESRNALMGVVLKVRVFKMHYLGLLTGIIY